MKSIFIEAEYNGKVKFPNKLINLLPGRIALFTTVQFVSQIGSMKEQLKGKKVMLLKPKHSRYKGQLLGCGIEYFNGNFDAFLYVGDGLFHPKTLMLKNQKPVFAFNPYSTKFSELKRKDIDRMLKKQKAGLVKFYSSDEIGVLISSKHGQNNIIPAEGLKKRFPDKNFYFLVSDTLDFSQLENFPFIQCFVNTACPRIGFDDYSRFKKSIINFEEIPCQS